MATNSNNDQTILGLDIGTKRIGVARAIASVGFAHPLQTLENPATFMADISRVVAEQSAQALVVGMPRGLSGQDTQQTGLVKAFIAELRSHIDIPVYTTDEALTSNKAEAELNLRGKPYPKSAVDALAAAYILEDYIREHHKETVNV